MPYHELGDRLDLIHVLDVRNDTKMPQNLAWSFFTHNTPFVASLTTTDWTMCGIHVRTLVENTIIGTCMYTIIIQTKRCNKRPCMAPTIGHAVSTWENFLQKPTPMCIFRN